MTLEELAAATGLTANDLLGIWDTEASGSTEPTQKITAQQLAAAVKVLADLQGALTFDSVPTTGSTNPVTSGGIKTAIATAIATALQRTNITGQITVNNSHVRSGTANAFLIGGLGILSFSLDIDSSLANNTILLTFNSALNIQGLYVQAALFKSTAAVATTASVFFERVNGATVVKYYKDPNASAPSDGQYFTQLIFMLQP